MTPEIELSRAFGDQSEKGKRMESLGKEPADQARLSQACRKNVCCCTLVMDVEKKATCSEDEDHGRHGPALINMQATHVLLGEERQRRHVKAKQDWSCLVFLISPRIHLFTSRA